MAYALGAVKPYVQDVADQVGERFKLTTIYGWRATATDMQGHPAGLALDFPVATDRDKGDAIARYFETNAAGLQVRYIIWQQRIWKPGTPTWTLMATRSGASDINHLRHVHVSFNPDVADGRRLGVAPAGDGAAASIAPTNAGAGDPVVSSNPLAALAQGVGALTSRSTWMRALQIVGGIALIGGGALILAKDTVIPAASAALSLTPQGRVAGAAGAALSKVG